MNIVAYTFYDFRFMHTTSYFYCIQVVISCDSYFVWSLCLSETIKVDLILYYLTDLLRLCITFMVYPLSGRDNQYGPNFRTLWKFSTRRSWEHTVLNPRRSAVWKMLNVPSIGPSTPVFRENWSNRFKRGHCTANKSEMFSSFVVWFRDLSFA